MSYSSEFPDTPLLIGLGSKFWLSYSFECPERSLLQGRQATGLLTLCNGHTVQCDGLK